MIKQEYILFHKIIFVNKYLLKNHIYDIFPTSLTIELIQTRIFL